MRCGYPRWVGAHVAVRCARTYRTRCTYYNNCGCRLSSFYFNCSNIGCRMVFCTYVRVSSHVLMNQSVSIYNNNVVLYGIL